MGKCRLRHLRAAKILYAELFFGILVNKCPVYAAEFERNITYPEYNQRYTGSLLAPSGSLYKTGDYSIEQYETYQRSMSNYDVSGNLTHFTGRCAELGSSAVMKYALKDTLTLQTTVSLTGPCVSRRRNERSSAISVQDLPIFAVWRPITQTRHHMLLSINLFAGVLLPIGSYENLHPKEEATGRGQSMLVGAVTAQTVIHRHHRDFLRVRSWFQEQRSMGSTRLHGANFLSSVPTFTGRARSGISRQAGLALEYPLTEKWILAGDVVSVITASSRMCSARPGECQKFGSEFSFSVAPAIEYNWSVCCGIVIGAQITAFAKNSIGSFIPQFAINIVK